MKKLSKKAKLTTSGVSSFSVWLCGSSWLLIKVSLNLEKPWSTKPPYGSNLTLLMFTISCILAIPVYSDKLVESSKLILFHLWADKTKAANGEQTFLDRLVYLAHDWRVCLILLERIVSPEVIDLLFRG